MKWSIEQKVCGGFGMALLGLAAIGTAFAISNQHFTETLVKVEHTQQILSSLHEISASLLSVETAARGYIITGNDQFLQHYSASSEKVGQAGQSLRSLIHDQPDQLGRLSDLEALITQRLAHGKNLIELRSARGLEAAAAAASQKEGRLIADRIRQVVSDMEQSEQTSLLHYSVAARRSNARTQAILISGLALGATVTLLALWILRRDFEMRRKSEWELRRMTEKLQAAFEENKAILDNSLDVICAIDRDGRFSLVSPASEKLWGYLPVELIGRRYSDLVFPDDLDKTTEAARGITAGHAVRDFENRYVRKDGSVIHVNWSASWSEKEKTIFCVARDNTEKIRAHQEIQRLNADLETRARQLESSNRELESFSYSVSHDLRAPLRHIIGFEELLRKNAGASLEARCQRYLKVISDSARQMGELIDDLLRFAQIGRSELHRASVNIQELCEEIRGGMHLDVHGRNIIWVNGNLPSVYGDPALLKQVLVNLLSNAVKYTRQRDPARIEIGCDAGPPGEFVFFVRDNGAGFDMRYAAKLFGVFQRLHRSEEFEGTGIGLATVKRIITRHGGRVWAEAQPDAGATFFFSVPKQNPA